MQQDNRTRIYCAPNMVSNLCLGFSGTVRTVNGNEAAMGNDVTVTAAIELNNPSVFTQLTFSGSNTGTIPNGGMVISDSLLCKYVVSQNTLMFARTGFRIAN